MGCELCGDWPVRFIGKCHPTAPLIARLEEDGTLVLSCFLPECGKEVWRGRIESGERAMLQRLYDACMSLSSGGISLASKNREIIHTVWDLAMNDAHKMLHGNVKASG